MRNMSLKRAKQNREYLKLREKYLNENPTCEINVDGCTIDATEIHHAKGRIGYLLTEIEFFKATCRKCHIWAELHPKEAKEKGVSFSRLNKT